MCEVSVGVDVQAGQGKREWGKCLCANARKREKEGVGHMKAKGERRALLKQVKKSWGWGRLSQATCTFPC